MLFDDFDWNLLFPNYLNGEGKDRLKNALRQFRKEENSSDINYDNFYFLELRDYFMQSDVLVEIRFPHWNGSEFEKKYCNSIILTNTCDISKDNNRDVNVKDCLFAPVIELETYIEDLSSSGYLENEKLNIYIENIKRQIISNLFYLPPNHKNGKEYIVLLDKLFWFPTEELNSFLPTIDDEKLFSLNHFGYYLFMLKLSYHMCRLPEACDRAAQVA